MAAGEAGKGAPGGAKSPNKINIHLADDEAMAMLRMVLAYEASIRGRTIGQVCSELVMEAVDVDSYPPEVRARLDEIESSLRQQAIERSLASD